MRALLVLSALLSAAALLLAFALRAERPRLAPPAAAQVPAEPDPGVDPEALPPCEAAQVARGPGPVTALLLASDGALWLGSAGEGLVRAEPGEAPRALVGLDGAERTVNALAEHDGLVWAATDGGAIAWDGERRVATRLAGSAVYALARARGALLAASARGIHRISTDAEPEDLRLTGPRGEPVAATALAAGPRTLWIGSAGGAYSVALSTLDAPLLVRAARWHPLAPAPVGGMGVVTSIAASADGAVAGTDGAGVLRLRATGPAIAVRLADAEANVASAAAPGAGGATLLGTAGGLLVVRPQEVGLSVGRPAGLEAVVVTALSARGEELLVGTIDGAVLGVRCGGFPRG